MGRWVAPHLSVDSTKPQVSASFIAELWNWPLTPDDLEPPLNQWCETALCRKSVFGWPSWVDIPARAQRRAEAAKLGRLPFVSREADRHRLVVNLADETSAALEAVRLQVLAWKRDTMEDLTATFEVLYEGNWLCIARVDCRPRGPHSNKHWRRFGCPASIDGSHVHPFLENAQVGREAFQPVGNLPVAIPIETEPQSFRDFARLCSGVFRIEELSELPAPPKQEELV